ncbi:MAG: HEAT repeat domain-containing protein [Verrucomicrobiaceae bacterium]|nr:HEAT repeat domain-containing protein [Verrucomicrobiaceae bacterium]
MPSLPICLLMVIGTVSNAIGQAEGSSVSKEIRDLVYQEPGAGRFGEEFQRAIARWKLQVRDMPELTPKLWSMLDWELAEKSDPEILGRVLYALQQRTDWSANDLQRVLSKLAREANVPAQDRDMFQVAFLCSGIQALEHYPAQAVETLAVSLLDDADLRIRRAAAVVLGSVGSEKGLKELQVRLQKFKPPHGRGFLYESMVDSVQKIRARIGVDTQGPREDSQTGGAVEIPESGYGQQRRYFTSPWYAVCCALVPLGIGAAWVMLKRRSRRQRKR